MRKGSFCFAHGKMITSPDEIKQELENFFYEALNGAMPLDFEEDDEPYGYEEYPWEPQ